MPNKFLSDIELDADLIDVNGNTGTEGQILSSLGTGSGIDWINQGDVIAGEADKAKSVILRVKNSTGSAMSKGQVICEAVSASPPSGNLIEVKLADNNGTDSMPALGVLNEDLDAAGDANDEGDAIMFGKVSGIDTSAFSVGDEVFVDDTPGGLTTTKPTGVKYIQKVGVVIRDDASNGTIEVFGAGRVNDVPTPLYIDHDNQRLGIGEEDPDTLLHLSGNSPTIKLEDNVGIDYYNPKIEFFGSLEGGTLEYISNPSFAGMQLHYINSSLNKNTFLRLTSGKAAFVSDVTGGATLETDGVLKVTGSNNSYFSNGNVGIGTTGPQEKLAVDGSIRIPRTEEFYWTDGSVNGNPRAVIFSTDNEFGGDYNGIGFSIGANGRTAPSMYIRGTGKVGIGQTNPTAKLEVRQDANNGNTGAFTNTHIKLTASATADGSGFTGITAATSTADNYGYSFGAQRTSGGVGDFKINYHNNSAAGTNRFIIDQDGNVGIGTTNPNQKLTIRGNDKYVATEQTNYAWGGTNTIGVRMGTSTAGLLDFRRWDGGVTHGTAVITQVTSDGGWGLDFRVDNKSTNTAATTSRMFLSTSGEVGIGTTGPAEKLHVYNGSAYITPIAYAANQNDWVIRAGAYNNTAFDQGLKLKSTSTGASYMAFETTAGETMVLIGDKVGIGTDSPGEKLEVSGNIKTTTVTITEGSTVTYTGGGTTYETLGTNVAFARGSQGAMYNPLLNPGGWSYASRNQAPIGLLFNTDGWSNLTNIQERNYLSFVYALGNNVGSNIVNTELIMWDYLNDNYYKLKFTAWGQGGGGGYTYQRTPLTINNKRSIATDTISTNKITVGDKINMPSGIRLASNIDMGSPANDRWADLLVDPGQSTVKIVTDTVDDNNKITENQNVRIGHGVGKNIGTGVKELQSNVLIGSFISAQSTNTNTTSQYNVFIGNQAGYDLGQGGASNNVGIGRQALYNIQGGDYNTAIGNRAGVAVTDGSNNTFIGNNAGDNLTTGGNNATLGYGADPSSSSVFNTITLGNSSIAALRCQVTSITSLSDKRDKTNIEPSTYGLNVINKLNPVTFDWNMRDEGKVGDKDLGFVAQDLQEVDDENLKLVYEDNPEKLEASYGRLIPVMTKAIQELSAKIEVLESKIQTLENQ